MSMNYVLDKDGKILGTFYMYSQDKNKPGVWYEDNERNIKFLEDAKPSWYKGFPKFNTDGKLVKQ